MARIRVSDATLVGVQARRRRQTAVAVLGRLVEAAIRRDRAQRVRENDVSAREIMDALDRAQELRDEVAGLTATLEFLQADRARR